MFIRKGYCTQDETCPIERIVDFSFQYIKYCSETKEYCEQNETLKT